jgi:hypothetical protein
MRISLVLAVALLVAWVGDLAFAVPPSVLCDYNRNGVCDAADYTVWRETLGSHTDLRANGDNSNLVIDFADYTFWKFHFGESSGAGGAAWASTNGTGVPEPGSCLLSVIAMVGFGLCRRGSILRLAKR